MCPCKTATANQPRVLERCLHICVYIYRYICIYTYSFILIRFLCISIDMRYVFRYVITKTFTNTFVTVCVQGVHKHQSASVKMARWLKRVSKRTRPRNVARLRRCSAWRAKIIKCVRNCVFNCARKGGRKCMYVCMMSSSGCWCSSVGAPIQEELCIKYRNISIYLSIYLQREREICI